MPRPHLAGEKSACRDLTAVIWASWSGILRLGYFGTLSGVRLAVSSYGSELLRHLHQCFRRGFIKNE